MDSAERIKKRIQEIAQRPRNVELSEIEWVIDQLRGYHDVTVRKTKHGMLFRIGDQQFMVSGHNPGSTQIKACYVAEFLNAMLELEWYE